MRIARSLLAFAAPLALLALGGCATGFSANVSRFSALPVPAGQSFVVQPADPRNAGGLEFASYAQLVTAKLVQQGYQVAQSPQAAGLVVTLDYGVDNGQPKVVTTPGFGGWGGGWGGWGGGWGYGRFGRPFYYGWNDPFYYGSGWGPEVSSYTVYTSHLQLVIARTADGQHLFEGRARARSTTSDLTKLVPNLVEAMFTNFPGGNGEEVRITIPPERAQPTR